MESPELGHVGVVAIALLERPLPPAPQGRGHHLEDRVAGLVAEEALAHAATRPLRVGIRAILQKRRSEAVRSHLAVQAQAPEEDLAVGERVGGVVQLALDFLGRTLKALQRAPVVFCADGCRAVVLRQDEELVAGFVCSTFLHQLIGRLHVHGKFVQAAGLEGEALDPAQLVALAVIAVYPAAAAEGELRALLEADDAPSAPQRGKAHEQ
mmetsp:Transcript_121147/g.354020  ORF Transcript_121147/g.354020 Transcript_121147/m.354020 type:complete len:210 (+) Transcript_121147:983-1612(+)